MISSKNGTSYCNGEFISIEGRISWGCYYSTEGARLYRSCNSTVNLVGESTLEALRKSKEVNAVEGKIMFTDEKRLSEYKKQLEYEMTTYNYKTETALYKNMMSCSISDDGERIEISPRFHRKSDIFEGLDAKYNIYISSDSPPEIIGAALKFAFTRCKGKGVDVVTKALFPDGTPNSLEGYLESVDPDYKKWLINNA